MGKTTASLSFSLSLARSGDRVLYVEIGGTIGAASILNAAPFGHDPNAVESNLDAVRLTGAECLKEYLLRQIRIERLHRLFFENRPVRRFFDVAPGLKDLMILGKIVFESEHGGENGPYDHIVVDLPSTGHAFILLRTPESVLKLSRFGPIFERARHIISVLQSPRRTRVHAVSLPRPVVVAETLEMLATLRNEKLPVEELIVNRVLLPEEDLTAARSRDPAVRVILTRAKAERREVRHLKNLARTRLLLLPEAFGLDAPDALVRWFRRGVSYG